MSTSTNGDYGMSEQQVQQIAREAATAAREQMQNDMTALVEWVKRQTTPILDHAADRLREQGEQVAALSERAEKQGEATRQALAALADLVEKAEQASKQAQADITEAGKIKSQAAAAHRQAEQAKTEAKAERVRAERAVAAMQKATETAIARATWENQHRDAKARFEQQWKQEEAAKNAEFDALEESITAVVSEAWPDMEAALAKAQAEGEGDTTTASVDGEEFMDLGMGDRSQG